MTLAVHQPTSSAYDLFNPEKYAVLERMAGTLLKSRLLPQTFTAPEQVIAVMLKAYELGVPPMEGLSGIAIIKGKPSVSPQLMLAMVQRAHILENLEIDATDERCVITGKRRGMAPVRIEFGRKEADAMGLLGEQNYKKQPRVMFQWRAVGAWCRVVTPDVIAGMYTPEEMGAAVSISEDGGQEIVTVPAESITVLPPALPAAPVHARTETRAPAKGMDGPPISDAEADMAALETDLAPFDPTTVPGVRKGQQDRSEPRPITPAQVQALAIALKELKFSLTDDDKNEAREFVAFIAKRTTALASVKDLTFTEARLVLDRLGSAGDDGKYRLNDEQAANLLNDFQAHREMTEAAA